MPTMRTDATALGRIDAVVARVAARQHALVTTSQALALGMTRQHVKRRVESGRWETLRRGVHAIAGTPPTWHRQVMSAVLAAGPTAFASHATAARLWSLALPTDADALEVTTVLERRPRVPGVRMHRSGLLVERDVTMVERIPVSSVERTIVDLSGRLAVSALATITDDALRRRLTSLTRLTWCCERLPRAPGRSQKRVRELLADRVPGWAPTESALEDFVYGAIRASGLPLPVPQVRIVVGGRTRRADFAYPEHRLVIEVDGFDVHRQRRTFDDDRARANDFVLAGYSVLRFTSNSTAEQITTTVAAALGLALPLPPPLPFGQFEVVETSN
jgi:hypothetical protein